MPARLWMAELDAREFYGEVNYVSGKTEDTTKPDLPQQLNPTKKSDSSTSTSNYPWEPLKNSRAILVIGGKIGRTASGKSARRWVVSLVYGSPKIVDTQE